MFSEIADPYVKQFDLMTFAGWKTLKAVQVSLHTNIHPLNRCVEALNKLIPATRLELVRPLRISGF
jgi:hypothetical protein